MAGRDTEKLFALLKARSAEIIGAASLKKKLDSGRTLRVKLGIDPTTPELHLGHVVPLRLLRAFQDAGHRAVKSPMMMTARCPASWNERRSRNGTTCPR